MIGTNGFGLLCPICACAVATFLFFLWLLLVLVVSHSLAVDSNCALSCCASTENLEKIA